MPCQWQNLYSDEKLIAKASNLVSRVQAGLPWASDIGSETCKVGQAKEDMFLKVGYCLPLDIYLNLKWNRRMLQKNCSLLRIILSLPEDKLPPQGIHFYVAMNIEIYQLNPHSLTAKFTAMFNCSDFYLGIFN